MEKVSPAPNWLASGGCREALNNGLGSNCCRHSVPRPSNPFIRCTRVRLGQQHKPSKARLLIKANVDLVPQSKHCPLAYHKNLLLPLSTPEAFRCGSKINVCSNRTHTQNPEGGKTLAEGGEQEGTEKYTEKSRQKLPLLKLLPEARSTDQRRDSGFKPAPACALSRKHADMDVCSRPVDFQ
ncbi:hypothetical protein PoB_002380100 [Plakobranchus ocellatus]|uniref:Uncharacterized protein n=1 Tax=Plakobranchus ocellatus TaxID=259542 RepID=A0AAV3ZDG9_9GAST|nr:hypothetical protein PoB_002380100 [Plakobranchus ocellatus]